MEPIVDLAGGADENALAVEFARVLRTNLGTPVGEALPPLDEQRRLADFRALRCTVLLVPDDRGDPFTMRFDHGRVTLHDGALGIPTVTFLADEAVLRRLFDVPVSARLRLPLPKLTDVEERAAFRRFLMDLAGSGLTVYGLWAHPRTVLRLLRILSCRRA